VWTRVWVPFSACRWWKEPTPVVYLHRGWDGTPSSALRRFLAECCEDPETGEGFSLARSLPMPELLPRGERLSLPNGGTLMTMSDEEFAWCVEHWGTKWDVDVVGTGLDLRARSGEASFSFESAWSPPVAWLCCMADRHPELELRMWYCETGCDFAGVAIARGGKVEDHCFGAVDLAEKAKAGTFDDPWEERVAERFDAELAWCEDEEDEEDEDG